MRERSNSATKSHAMVALLVAMAATACASGESQLGLQGGASFGDGGTSSSGSSGGSSGSTSSSGASSGGDDGSGGSSGDDGAPADDGATASDDGSSSSTDDSGDDGATPPCSSCTDAGPPDTGSTSSTYACTTPLTPAPVCDRNHDFCLCTADAQCNSNGTDVVNKGGCNSQHCQGAGTCTGGQNVDSAGCSIVGPTCNLPGNQACPSDLICEINHGGCGGQVQCCWCTSDSACPVSKKCVNDATQNQCSGKGPCTGSGTNYDGMHCELASPGIPMCTAQ